MYRRQVLTISAVGMTGSLAGCLDVLDNDPGENEENGDDRHQDAIIGENIDVSFDRDDPQDALQPDDPPEVERSSSSVTILGNLYTGPGDCSIAKLADAGYEETTKRLDIVVVAADDPDRFDGSVADECVPTLNVEAYQVEATVNGHIEYAIATEHEGLGESYTTVG